MRHTVKSEILGPNTLFPFLKEINNANIAFTLVNPFALREHIFDITAYINALLDVKENSKLLIKTLALLSQLEILQKSKNALCKY